MNWGDGRRTKRAVAEAFLQDNSEDAEDGHGGGLETAASKRTRVELITGFSTANA
jgi:hypothetical protein